MICIYMRCVLASILLLSLPFSSLSQVRHSAYPDWTIHGNFCLISNVFIGDRYVAYNPNIPNLPLRDLDFTRVRSFVHNSFSPAAGFLFEKRVWKSYYVSVGMEYVDRTEKFVFSDDTLQVYPPIFPAPNGLRYKKIIDHVFELNLPIMADYRFKNWSFMVGVNFAKEVGSKGKAIAIDGTDNLLYRFSSRHSVFFKTAIPRIQIQYSGIGRHERFPLLFGTELRRNAGFGRWLDFRIGIGLQFGE